MSMGIILAIDCGTTSVRVLAFNKSSQLVHTEQQELPLSHPKPDWVEQDPHTIWTFVEQCLTKTIHTLGVTNIHAIGITNQRETAVIWQKSTGMPLGPAINWQCRRTTKRCRELNEYAPLIKEKTGLPLDPYFSASKFEWLVQTNPNVQALLRKNDLCFGTIDTWLLYNLTNKQSYATDATNASRTMLFNIQTQTYDSELCDLFQLPIHALPEVKDSCSYFGDYIIQGISIPIRAILGDQQAALYAQSSIGQIKNTYGTGLFMMANTGTSMIKTKDLITTVASRLNGVVSYAIEGSVFTGGALIQWLRDQLNLIETAAETEVIAQRVSDNGGVTIIPALTGLGAPHWLPDAKGMITGLTRQSNKSHIIRAALESIALQSNDIITLIKKECPHIAFEELLVDGGASANNWLMQLQADVSELTVKRPHSIEATALGVAKCAAFFDHYWEEVILSKMSTFLFKSDQNVLKSQWQSELKKLT